jgi:glycosyltransferase involved in cell wall biosynthesis
MSIAPVTSRIASGAAAHALAVGPRFGRRASDRPGPNIRDSVVVPIYKNQDSIPALVDRLVLLDEQRGGLVEGVFVIDGSPDDSLAVLRSELAGRRLTAQVLTHSRNFGSWSACRTGLAAARGQFVGVMAADLQEPPELVVAFLDALGAGECDIALGKRIGRDDPRSQKLMANLYWRLYRRFMNPEIPTGGIDIFGCTREIAQLIVSLPETRTSPVGLLYWLGFRRSYFEYRRQPRHSGTSGWTFTRKLRLLFDSIYAFTDLPIILLQIVGFIGTFVSVFVGLLVFFGWLAGLVKEPGYTPIMIAIAGSTSAIMLALGVVGSYVWRAYENGKGRPLELVASHEFLERQPR